MTAKASFQDASAAPDEAESPSGAAGQEHRRAARRATGCRALHRAPWATSTSRAWA
jgi:hypothetical protein